MKLGNIKKKLKGLNLDKVAKDLKEKIEFDRDMFKYYSELIEKIKAKEKIEQEEIESINTVIDGLKIWIKQMRHLARIHPTLAIRIKSFKFDIELLEQLKTNKDNSKINTVVSDINTHVAELQKVMDLSKKKK